MKGLRLTVVLAACVAFPGCATKGWVTEQLDQTKAQISTQIRTSEGTLKQAIRTTNLRINAQQREVRKVGEAMAMLNTTLKRQYREMKMLEARISAGMAGTRELLMKEKELLKQRVRHIDILLTKMPGGRPAPKARAKVKPTPRPRPKPKAKPAAK